MKARIHAVAKCAYVARERHNHEDEKSKRSRLNVMHAYIPSLSPWSLVDQETFLRGRRLR